jgi:hypothetical protein
MNTIPPILLRTLAFVLGTTVVTGCAHGRQPCSYRPVGACAQYGDRTDDGVTLLLRMEVAAAVDAVAAALRATGYHVEHSDSERGTLRTAARRMGGDTTLAITAQVSPVELPEQAASVVLTATYSVASQRLRNVRVIRRPGETSPLYDRLRAVADTLRTSEGPAR